LRSHVVVKLVLLTGTPICRKSTDFSWDGGEISTSADGEDRSAEVREPTPSPQADVAVEMMLEEATLVEGTHSDTMSSYYEV
jgi:hypothetical protein